MDQGVIGQPFTFYVLFVDQWNHPLDVTDPQITIFYFTPGGVKVVLVDKGGLNKVNPPEVGQYVYTYTVPNTLVDGTILIAEMTGVDPTTPGTLISEQRVMVRNSLPSGSSCSQGLVARFIKG